MKYNSWAKHTNNPKFWKIFTNIVLETITNKTMKSVKIDVPEGYEIDKEKSTFENIVFKKIDEVVIKWNNSYGGVEIKAEGECFILNANIPSFYCNWNDAMRSCDKFIFNFTLPTTKQLKIISKYFKNINSVIKENNGFCLVGREYWSCETEGENRAKYIYTHNNEIFIDSKDNFNYVRAVYTL